MAKCDSCGQERVIFNERMKNSKIIEKFCKECSDNLHRIIKCKHYDMEMQNGDYGKHLSDDHSN